MASGTKEKEMKELTSDELVARAVKYARLHQVGGSMPRWALVMDVFNIGSSSAVALCRKVGVDLDEEVCGIACERCEESEDEE